MKKSRLAASVLPALLALLLLFSACTRRKIDPAGTSDPAAPTAETTASAAPSATEETNETTAPAETETAASTSEAELSRGTVSGSSYLNPALGFRVDLGAGWRFLSENQISDTLGRGFGMIGIDPNQADTVADVVAARGASLQDILIFTVTLARFPAGVGMDAVLEESLTELRQSIGANVSHVGSVPLAGRSWERIDYVAEIQSMSISVSCLIAKIGEELVSVALTSCGAPLHAEDFYPCFSVI
jgi:hypothetical protein